MTLNLPVEILYEILNEFVIQDDTKAFKTLFSCLLVNKLWCQITVPILWRDPWNFKIWDTSKYKHRYRAMFNILILFLSDNSIEYLKEYGIEFFTIQPKYSFRSNPRRIIDYNTSTLFNYPSFCKNLSIYHINKMIDLGEHQLRYCKTFIIKEILKLFISESSHFLYMHIENTQYDITRLFSNDKTSLAFSQITELIIGTKVESSILHQLSQLCQNIKRLNLTGIDYPNQGMIDLIKVQKNLNYLEFNSNLIDKKKDKQTISLGNMLKLKSNSIISLNFKNELQITLEILPYFTQNLRELKFEVNTRHRLLSRFYLKLESIKFSQLESLECNLPFKVLAKVIEKSGNKLKRIIHKKGCYNSNEIEFLINAISSNCFKLKCLHIEIKDIDDLLQLLNFYK
ncbi:hypothetical protein GLOIN_2v1728613 [Rhizophagus clarus]|uniref:F-box domain-containing protein n=1 Tax=Rhizophagus clarus TaxID=94130 RepID=A0A8H3L8H4_9GLOM|nr:hypothetical protein GLOIN_2v1728613 [Rhizophagus clarus]